MRKTTLVFREADREFMTGLISIALAFVSLYQLGSGCGISNFSEMFRSFSGDATFIDFALFTLSNLILGMGAADSLDAIADTKQYQRANREVKRAYLKARSCVFAQEITCVATVVFVYSARSWMPCLLMFLIAIAPMFLLVPYYRIMLSRFLVQLAEVYTSA